MAVLAGAAGAGISAAAAQPPRPVLIQSNPNLDSRPSTGAVRGLNPHVQNYLPSAPRPDPGPCRSGWVSRRYIAIVAG